MIVQDRVELIGSIYDRLEQNRSGDGLRMRFTDSDVEGLLQIITEQRQELDRFEDKARTDMLSGSEPLDDLHAALLYANSAIESGRADLFLCDGRPDRQPMSMIWFNRARDCIHDAWVAWDKHKRKT